MTADIKRLEKKTFPQSEAFDFDAELKKRNIKVLVAVRLPLPAFPSSAETVGYLVYQRTKRVTLLHKICVAQSWRRKRIGKGLLEELIRIVAAEGCDVIQLWVDEAREPARKLYSSCGFGQTNVVMDYYGPGRTGLQMSLKFA